MAERPAESAPAWLRTSAAIGWRVLVVVAVTALVLWLAARLYLATAPVVIALFLATVAVPAARWLERLRLPRTPAAAVTVLGGLIVLLGLIGLAVPRFVSEMGQLGEQVQKGWEAILQWVEGSQLPVSADQLRQLVDRTGQEARANAGRLLTGALGGVALVAEILTIGLLSLIVLFFLVKDREPITGWILRQAPEPRREAVRRGAERAWATLTGYVHGLVIVATGDAVAIGLGLLLIGVPLVLPLTALTFFGAFIPIVGAFAAGLVAVLVALVSGGPTDALLVLGLFFVVQQLEGNFLQPVVMGRVVQLHPVVVLLVLTAGATVAGIAGAFLAVPVTAVLAAVTNELRSDGDGPPPTAEEENGDA
ncbi:MAG: AI-2E family transporter [Actinomycetota bacterium]|nr:AI-2E family transporter [Actinomycetota bacterium]